MDYKAILLVPRMSEKSYQLSQVQNTYVFDVPKEANKHVVARAVESQFKVKVSEVNISNLNGKAKRTVRKSGRAVMGRQSDVRKAYVKLAAGNSLPFFAELEKEAAEAEKAAEKAKGKK